MKYQKNFMQGLKIYERKKSPLFKGYPFEELHDLKKLRPKDEGIDLYVKVRKIVADSGKEV